MMKVHGLVRCLAMSTSYVIIEIRLKRDPKPAKFQAYHTLLDLN